MISYNTSTVIDSSLILYLDAANTRSYPGSGTAWYDLSGNNNHFTLYNGPTYSNGSIVFDGTNDYAASNNNLNLSSFTQITCEIWVKCSNTTASMAIEHTANWNATLGGWGLATNADGNTSSTNMNHTNHHGAAGGRNYLFNNMGTGWNSHVNIFSIISDATGRLTYTNGALQAFTGPYTTSTSTSATGVFTSAILYLASRGGANSFLNGSISIVKIYGNKQNSNQIIQNFNAHRGRYGV